MTATEEPRVEQGYPPDRHVLRDLDFEVTTTSAEEQVGTYLPAGEGPVELGGVATVVDLMAGSLCMPLIAPDWMATSALTLHLAGPLPTDEVRIAARLLRAGRTTVALGIDLHDRSGGPLGEGTVTFSRLARRDANLTLDEADVRPGATFSFPARAPLPVGRGDSLRAAIGCEVLDAARGATSTPVGSYVRNSFGAMNGGVVATLVDVAARLRAGADGGPGAAPPVVTDLVVHYLAPGRTGPVRTGARMVRSGGGYGSVAVEVVEAGGPTERVMALAHVGVAHGGSHTPGPDRV